ncbi:MAG: TetR/AcrR family transcriptional regulator [Mycobacterium sp.]|nr:TetR/AcrR family transcriptional regulator [Mycobacterium sp.]
MNRRHGSALEAALRSAVIGQLDTHGYHGLTYEGVAAAARTSKTVLYRRWPTKAQMVVSALGDDIGSVGAQVPDTGSLAGDLTALLSAVRDEFSDHKRAAVLGLLADLDDRAAAQMRDHLLVSASDMLIPLLDRARRRHELGSVELPARALRLPFDLLLHDALIRGRLRDNDIGDIVSQCVVPLYASLSRGILLAHRPS